jgi:hypothetical protein
MVPPSSHFNSKSNPTMFDDIGDNRSPSGGDPARVGIMVGDVWQ